MSQRVRNAVKTGFTLLEVLIALSLVATLMVLAWSLLATFTRLESRARRTVGGLEITRSLQRQLQDDLDQIVNFSLEPVNSKATPSLSDELNELLPDSGIELGISASDKSGSLSGERAGRSLLDQLPDGVDTEYEYLTKAIFQGDSQSIAFVVPGKRNKSQEGGEEEWAVVSYEWKTIDRGQQSGLSADNRSGTDPSGFDDEALSDDSVNLVQRTNRVFVRRVRSLAQYQQEERFSLNSEDQTLAGFETIEVGRASTSIDRGTTYDSELVDEMPEISDISFRYFDGRSWSSGWSSNDEATPVAVELVFKIETDDRKQPQDDSDDEDESEFELGSEIEIGLDTLENSDSEFAEQNSALADINPAFDPDSIRIVIRLGTRTIDQNQSSELEDGTSNSELFLEFENGGVR